MPSSKKRFLWPLVTGLAGGIALTLLYFGIVSLVESPEHAIEFFWHDRWIVIPIIVGFGIQVALFTILKMRLFIPVAQTGHSGKLVGTSGATSALAMVACCAHHVTDVLPILGLTAAATFLAQYRTLFMVIGLGTTLVGIAVMISILLRERRKALRLLATPAAEAI